MIPEVKARTVPWPGPRPYDEEDWKRFRGRGNELRRLMTCVNGQDLTLLAGGSGTGKTSLLRAGLVPLLRLQRYDNAGPRTAWPVLVLRRWGAQSVSTIGQMLLSQVDRAVKAIQYWGQQPGQEAALKEAENLRSLVERERTHIEDTQGVVRLLERLVSTGVADGAPSNDHEGDDRLYENDSSQPTEGDEVALGREGIILVFDQFEELLRSGGDTARDALAVVQNLYLSNVPTRLLLSLREEYLPKLRSLEQTLGTLAERVVYIEPMREGTVVQAVTDASADSDLPLEAGVAEEVVNWLAADRGKSSHYDGTGSDGSGSGDPSSRPDLLKLQAVLRELFQFCVARCISCVDSDVLDTFGRWLRNDGHLEGSHETSASSETELRELFRQNVKGALERWLEHAILREIEAEDFGDEGQRDESAAFSYAPWADMNKDELARQVRRIAVRLGPNLSSLDYKVPQEESLLFRLALGEDIWRLGLRDAKLRDTVRVMDGRPPTINWRDLNLAEEFSDDLPAFSSGLARRETWSPVKTANQLVVCFRETLHRLAQANILTYTLDARRDPETGKERIFYIWELVHDQFGPTFTAWGNAQKNTWDDCAASLVLCSGVQPLTVPRGKLQPRKGEHSRTLRNLSWQGCAIEPIGEGKLELERVKFENCFLVGSIFKNCRFVGGAFERCKLDGALFLECEFVRESGSGPLVFTDCHPTNLAFLDSTIGVLEFRNCELHQVAIKSCGLDGKIRFSEQCRVAQGFFDIEPRGSRDVGIEFEDGCRAFFCSASLRSIKYLDMGFQRDVASGALPAGFFTRQMVEADLMEGSEEV